MAKRKDMLDEDFSDEDLRLGIECAYNEMVLAGRVRFEKREYPRSHLEDELATYMAWEIYGLFGTTSRKTDIYRNSLNGNYMLKIFTPMNGRSASLMKGKLEERLGKVYFGHGDYFGTTARPVCVRKEGNEAVIEIEYMIPEIKRYINIIKSYGDFLCGSTYGFPLPDCAFSNSLNSGRD